MLQARSRATWRRRGNTACGSSVEAKPGIEPGYRVLQPRAANTGFIVEDLAPELAPDGSRLTVTRWDVCPLDEGAELIEMDALLLSETGWDGLPRFAKPLYAPKAYRGFESLRLRQIVCLTH
jgi:hypothetical protein